jgi:integrase
MSKVFNLEEVKEKVYGWYKVNKPSTKETTLKVYVNCIKNTNDLLSDDKSFLIETYHDHDKVFTALNSKKYSKETIKKRITAIIALLKAYNCDNKVIEGYTAYLTNTNKDLKVIRVARREEPKEFKYSEKKRAKIQSKYEEKLSKIDVNNVTQSDRKVIRKYIIFCLYTLNAPVRTEYSEMIVVNKYDESMSKEFNYMDLDNKLFVFCKHKEVEYHGTITVPINEQLYDIIMKYRPLICDVNVSKHLLVGEKGATLSHHNLSRFIKKVFKIGIIELRQYTVSQALQQLIELQKNSVQLAHDMLHSPIVQKDYYLHLTNLQE